MISDLKKRILEYWKGEGLDVLSPGHLLRLPSALTQPSLPPLSVQFVGRQCCLTGQKRLLLSSCAWPAFGCGLDDSGWEFMYYCLERVIFFTATQPILPL